MLSCKPIFTGINISILGSLDVFDKLDQSSGWSTRHACAHVRYRALILHHSWRKKSSFSCILATIKNMPINAISKPEVLPSKIDLKLQSFFKVSIQISQKNFKILKSFKIENGNCKSVRISALDILQLPAGKKLLN